MPEGKSQSLEEIKGIHKPVSQYEITLGHESSKIPVSEPKNNTEMQIQMREMKQLFGKDFLGIEVVKRIWGHDISEDKVPSVYASFSGQELRRAKELGFFLELRSDKADDDTPLNMIEMDKRAAPAFQTQYNERPTQLNVNTEEEFLQKETPILRWALFSKKVIPKSDGDYMKQTQAIAEFLQEFYNGFPIPQQYEEALEEFNRIKKSSTSLLWRMKSRTKQAEALVGLKLNQLTRRTAAEAGYDFFTLALSRRQDYEPNYQGTSDWLHKINSDENILHSDSTKTLSSRGLPVNVTSQYGADRIPYLEIMDGSINIENPGVIISLTSGSGANTNMH